MKIIGVIPARWGSTRFEGKVLAMIAGKPMIQHVWERVSQSKSLDQIIIACDDERVMDVVKGFGADCVMTAKDHPSGTDRIIEAVQNIECDCVINIQGDEPLIDPQVIDDLAEAMKCDDMVCMGTVIKKFADDEDVADPNIVKVVIDANDYALYFSRSIIPFSRDGAQAKYFKHLGIYAYRRDFLMGYKNLPESMLEQVEKLEQLRVLEAGYKIKTVKTEFQSIGVDTPEDLKRVEGMFA